MKDKPIFVFAVLVYLLGLFGLSLTFFNLYRPSLPDPSIGVLWWPNALFPIILSAYFYYAGWYNRKNPFLLKITFMLATANLLWFGVGLSADRGGTFYTIVVSVVLIIVFLFMVYTVQLFSYHTKKIPGSR